MEGSARASAAGGGGIGTILIVEDNPDMRALIRDLLAGLASIVHECDDGTGAVALYQRHRPDWVLMDIGLTGSDGITATRAICDIDPDARVVIVTQYDDQAHRDAAARAGACGYLAKANLIELPRMLAP